MARYDNPEESYYLGEVIGSFSTYHRPTCHIVSKIERCNYKRLRDWREAVDLGLQPCSICRPYKGDSTNIGSGQTDAANEKPENKEPLSASQLADRRRIIIRLLDVIDSSEDNQSDGNLAKRIRRLSWDKKIPRTIATCMRNVTEARNVAEYDAKILTPEESDAVEASFIAIRKWATEEGIDVNWKEID